MPIDVNTREELEQIARGAISAFVDGADVSEGSDYDVSARLNAAVAHAAQRSAKHASLQIFPKTPSGTADDDFLVQHAQERGTSKQAAAAAVGRILVFASGGTPSQPNGSALTAPDGTQYVTTSSVACGGPTWPESKFVGDGSTTTRIVVTPSTTGMAAGDVVGINGESRLIREVLSSIGAIDLDGAPLGAAPATSTSIAGMVAAVLDVAAVNPGASTNKEIGSVLTLASPTPTITAATQVIELSGGGDEETSAELAQRLSDLYAVPPGSGNVSQLRELARATPGIRIDDAVVYPGFRGLGTVDIIPIGVAGARRVGQTVCDKISAYLATQLNTMALDVLVLPFDYTTSAYDVTLTTTTEPGEGADFPGVFTIVNGGTASHVKLVEDPRATVQDGMRVVVRLKRDYRYRSYTRTLVGVGWDGTHGYFDLDTPLPDAPISTDPTILSGGPLADAAIAAFEATFDELGPSAYQPAGGAIVYERFPSPGVQWIDRLLPGSFAKHLLPVTGVLDLVVSGVSSTVQPDPQLVAKPGLLTLVFVEA